MKVNTYVLEVDTTGAAGSASGSAKFADTMGGVLRQVLIDYDGTAPATTRVLLYEFGRGLLSPIVDVTGNTDIALQPVYPAHDKAGTAYTNGFVPVVLSGRKISVDVATSNALTPAVTITAIVSSE